MSTGLNGRFLCAPLTGVQRFGYEMLRHLPARQSTVLLVPADAIVPGFFTGTVVRGRLRGHAWEQLELIDDARRAGCTVVLHPANTLPLRAHASVVVAHDPLFPVVNTEWFTTRYVAWHRHVIARALRRAAAVLTVSEWSRSRLAVNAAIPLHRIGVVPQGIAPFDTPASDADVANVRARHDVPERYLLAMGGRDPRKNIRFVAPVLAELARISADVPPCIVIGDAHPRVHRPDPGVVEHDGMRLLGAMDTEQTHALLTGAAALLFPSFAESFGRPPLEALACGTPPLVGAYEAAREVLGGAGHVLAWDPALWARTLRDVLDDPHARRIARHQARPLLSRYSWPNAADVVAETCERVARAPTTRAAA